MTDKMDFKKSLDAYQAKRGHFRVVKVPDLQYLMIDGHGDPNTSPDYTEAIAALYPVAYKLKFASRQDLGRDYVVMPLEGLWWAEDMKFFTTARDKSRWEWTLMIMVPDWVDQRMFQAAVQQAGAKNRPARLGDIRLESLSEGRCVQTLHVGSFDDEAGVLARLHHDFLADQGCTRPASIMRSTSATSARWPPSGCGPSSGSPSATLLLPCSSRFRQWHPHEQHAAGWPVSLARLPAAPAQQVPSPESARCSVLVAPSRSGRKSARTV